MGEILVVPRRRMRIWYASAGWILWWREKKFSL